MMGDMQRYPLRLFFKDYVVSMGILIALLTDIFLWIYILVRGRALGDSAFLHYTIHFGVDFIGAWTLLLFIPALGLVIFAVHTGIGYWLYGYQKTLARTLLVSQAVLCAFLLMSAFMLFFIN